MTNNFTNSRRDLRERAFQALFSLEFGGEYLAAAEINQMRDAVNELFYKVLQAKIYENGQLQVFRKPGTPPDPTNPDPNPGDYCIGFVENQFINAEYLGPNKLSLTSYNTMSLKRG